MKSSLIKKRKRSRQLKAVTTFRVFFLMLRTVSAAIELPVFKEVAEHFHSHTAHIVHDAAVAVFIQKAGNKAHRRVLLLFGSYRARQQRSQTR